MAKNTIKLKKYADIVNEYQAGGVITPGHLINLNSAGKVVVHNVEGGATSKMFALESELVGKGIDDNFATNDKVKAWSCIPGEEVYAILKDGENVAVGDFLKSGGDGTLIKFIPAASAAVIEYPNSIVGQALEAVNMSGSVGVDPSPRIKIRIV